MLGKSSYDRGEQPRKTIYDTTGVVEGKVVDRQPGDDAGERRAGNSPEELGDLLGALKRLKTAKDAIATKRQDLGSRIKAALEKSRKLRDAEAKWGNPGGSGLVLRHSGLLHREKPQDSARFEALKANRDLPYLLFDYLVNLAKLEASGKRVGMELFDYLIHLDEEYPLELAPFGELFTEKGIDNFLEAYDQAVELLGDRGLAEIMQAMLVGSYRDSRD
jgi:hypothetical protein